MVKNLAILGTIVLLIYSCSVKQDNINDKILIQENELISQLFCDLVRPIPPPPPADTTTIEFRKYNNEFRRILDSVSYEIYLVDSLIIPDESYFSHIELSNEFQKLYDNLKNDSLIRSRRLNVESIVIKNNYKLITNFHIDSTYQEKVMHHNLMGIVEFSRVSFNSNFSKACFYQSISRGRNCGGGVFVFAEKLNNRWSIVLLHSVWVS